MKNKKGITLIAAILLMTLLAITTIGLTTMVVERLRFAATRENEVSAYYMAQAGIHYAIYQYEQNATTLGTYNDYNDRGFNWNVAVAGNIITITSTGYCPKTGNTQIQSILTASYDTNVQEITSIGYGN